MKDSVGICVYLLVFAVPGVLRARTILGHADNYIPANPLATPAEIVPEWYFLPFYAILRSVPNKLGGVSLMFGAIAVLFVLPWLDTSPGAVSARFRPIYRQLMMGAGAVRHRGAGRRWARTGRKASGWCWAGSATAWYFLHFLVLLPLLGKIEKHACRCPRASASPVLRKQDPRGRAAAAGRCPLAADRQADGQDRDAPALMIALLAGILERWLAWVQSPPSCAAGDGDCRLPPHQHLVVRAVRSARSTVPRPSAASKIYKEVCSNCHSMKQVYYRNLEGIGLTPDQVKAIAASVHRLRAAPTTRASRSNVRACRPTISARPSRTTRPRAPPTTARCRPTSRCWKRRARAVPDYIVRRS